MPQLIERRDLDFLLHEVLRLTELTAAARFSMHDRASFDAVLDAAQKIAEEEFLPHAAKLDANEPSFDGSRVALIPEVKQALAAYIDGGFIAASFPIEDGGLQLPYTLTAAAMGYFTAANAGTAGYPFLTAAAANLQRAHGSAAQKARYMRPMLEGRWFGTMCLSEPQAGSSLGDIRTRAIAQADGTYHLVGNKMWISGADHELSENIVHHVLARIDGAPSGVRGISLFIVPKFRVDGEGRIGARNGVHVAGLNHKMGYRGTVNAALNFGESEPAVGELIGEPNHGLAYMFHMMNEARIGVGMGAAALACAGYRYSLDYARHRPQGRPVANKDPDSRPVPIIEHADVRRMLLQQKVYAEGALALCLYCARLVDEQAIAEDEAQRHALHQLLEVLTPIAKSWPSEFGLEANKLAIQVLGGYGYTRDYPLERLYRDNRLNPIHEGTTGIQALDLLGRKVLMANGAAFRLLLARVTATADEAAALPALAEDAEALRAAVAQVAAVTAQLAAGAQRGEIERFLANATAYLEMLGQVVVAWMWLLQAIVAERALASAGDAEQAFYRGKRHACRFFTRYELPKIERLAALLKRFDDTCLTMPADGF
ncbi:acyl-CoA dehydrogenase [Solimonas flava]|uniref:acyl-CoA dehydrogenase n=1 Tax=Solimonas flava TaxID=415849 RepID=UPI00041DC85F|nr:acyl-CoA dehydrogenase [Solimonas flava]